MTSHSSQILQNSKHLTRLKYRPDIDGLRAIAVLCVIAYHAFPGYLRGGFIGVDIFFVISGYLISAIIFENLDKGTFSFSEFYARRIKRIFPALIFVLVACFTIGWFFLLADEYKQLGKHIAAGAGFISNIIFWKETGYFDNAADTKPLLHLWSLGIEEQFYIVWPLLLWLAWRQKFNLLTITLIITIVSLLLNLKGIKHDTVATFYSPQTRFWELLSGSILAWVTLYKNYKFTNVTIKIDNFLAFVVYKDKQGAGGKTLANFLSYVGLFMLLYGFWRINKELRFPGKWALVPVMGTLMLLIGGPKAWVNRIILSNKVVVWFGLISFPLYLWHWPLLSFVRIVGSEPPSANISIAVILLAILMAWLTYQFIEKPVRFGKNYKPKTIILIALMLIIGLFGYNCFKRDGFGFRLKERAEFSNYFENSSPEWRYFQKTGMSEKYNDKCNFYNINQHRMNRYTAVPLERIDQSCFEKDDAHYSRAVFIWGDSHASHLYFGLKKNLPANWQILQVASSMCNPDINAKGPSLTNYCIQSNWFALRAINQTKPDVVIVAQNTGQNIKSFSQISSVLKTMGVKKIIFTGPTPHWAYELPKIILKELWFNTPQRTLKALDPGTLTLNSSLQLNFTQTESVVYANIIDTMCNQDGCLTYIGDDKKTGITSFDFGHLTPLASDYVAKNLLVNLVIDNNAIVRR
jgi:peptidoglycan/LPS O-acetylase OafA/YrhL